MSCFRSNRTLAAAPTVVIVEEGRWEVEAEPQVEVARVAVGMGLVAMVEVEATKAAVEPVMVEAEMGKVAAESVVEAWVGGAQGVVVKVLVVLVVAAMAQVASAAARVVAVEAAVRLWVGEAGTKAGAAKEAGAVVAAVAAGTEVVVKVVVERVGVGTAVVVMVARTVGEKWEVAAMEEEAMGEVVAEADMVEAKAVHRRRLPRQASAQSLQPANGDRQTHCD